MNPGTTYRGGSATRAARRRGAREAPSEYPPLPADVLERLKKGKAAGQKKKAASGKSKSKKPKRRLRKKNKAE